MFLKHNTNQISAGILLIGSSEVQRLEIVESRGAATGLCEKKSKGIFVQAEQHVKRQRLFLISCKASTISGKTYFSDVSHDVHGFRVVKSENSDLYVWNLFYLDGKLPSHRFTHTHIPLNALLDVCFLGT